MLMLTLTLMPMLLTVLALWPLAAYATGMRKASIKPARARFACLPVSQSVCLSVHPSVLHLCLLFRFEARGR